MAATNPDILRDLNLGPSANVMQDCPLTRNGSFMQVMRQAEVRFMLDRILTLLRRQVASESQWRIPLSGTTLRARYLDNNENRVVMRSEFRADATPSNGNGLIVFSNPSELFALDASIQAAQTFIHGIFGRVPKSSFCKRFRNADVQTFYPHRPRYRLWKIGGASLKILRLIMDSVAFVTNVTVVFRCRQRWRRNFVKLEYRHRPWKTRGDRTDMVLTNRVQSHIVSGLYKQIF